MSLIHDEELQTVNGHWREILPFLHRYSDLRMASWRINDHQSVTTPPTTRTTNFVDRNETAKQNAKQNPTLANRPQLIQTK